MWKLSKRPEWVRKIIKKSSDMKKIKVSDCICHGKLFDHDKIKDRILYEIDKDICRETSGEGDSYVVSDRVSKLDWTKGNDFERPWVKIFFPNFDITINNFLLDLGYSVYDLKLVWYQQYLEGDAHGWHTHSGTYTGVYYLEFPEGSSQTELYSPFNFKKHIIKSKEGDIIIFPSHWIHRGPPNPSNRKTIISFNLEVNFLDMAMRTK